MPDQVTKLFDSAPYSGPNPGLFAPETPAFGIGKAEARAIATLEALHAETPFTPSQQLLAEVARSLAENIDRGNRKGRAVGNEAMQLMQCIATIAGDDDAPTMDALPDDVRKLLDALSTPPVLTARPDAA